MAPILEGRDFNDHDREDTQKVVIISKGLAHRMRAAGHHPLGTRIRFGRRDDGHWWTMLASLTRPDIEESRRAMKIFMSATCRPESRSTIGPSPKCTARGTDGARAATGCCSGSIPGRCECCNDWRTGAEEHRPATLQHGPSTEFWIIVIAADRSRRLQHGSGNGFA